MPASVGTSRARTLETGAAKLWALLVGVNQYADERFPTLAYSALDCQGLAEAVTAATRPFPQKSVLVHHDFAPLEAGTPVSNNRSLPDQVAVARRIGLGTVAKLRNFPASAPKLNSVQASLHRIVQAAKPQDTVLFYFSGHGMLDAATQQAVLCLSDTNRDHLAETGLGVQDVLQLLNQCAAHQQIVWLDACHSGGMTLRAAKPFAKQPELSNLTSQLVEVLQQQAARSQGFYALLSCDQNQLSWEFPELGHGVFTYYLMRGLLGEAADAQGMIEADALYKYVYYQTLRYIDKTNQQLRLINQQKRGKGQIQLQPEYPQQTPKRIVEGIGELIIGIKPETTTLRYPRQALVVEGLAANPAALSVSKILRTEGSFELTYFPQPQKDGTTLQTIIQTCLQSDPEAPPVEDLSHSATVLLYLRGQIKTTPTGDACLVMRQTEISRSWLRQELRRSPVARQVVILDCPNADHLEDWIEDLQIGTGRGQCLIAVASPADNPDWFVNTLHETLSAAEPQAGLPIAGWIAQIQIHAAAAGITPQIWLSGTQGVIEVLPGKIGTKSSDEAFDLGICPYLGLRAFSEDDAPFFFGRETLTQQLIHALMQQSFLAVVGASGSGKSSVVQAGLMAQIRQGQQIPGSAQWWLQSFRPGERPLSALAQCLATNETEQLQIEGILYQGVEGFVYWLRSRPEPMVVLIVDQFEELFTLAPAEDRQRFLDLVLGAIQHAGDRFKLVITLRSDFVASNLENPILARLLQQSSLLVPPVLDEADYRQIILRPAEKVGLAVEPELIEVLLQELSHSAGDLPLLEFVLEQLWEHRRPGTLTLETYQQKIGGLKGALERKAQAVYDSLDPDAQACARWIFLSLTQLGETTEDTRRRVTKANLIVKKYPAALIDRTLQALTAAKLVIVSAEAEPIHQSRNAADPSPPLPTSPLPTPVTIEVAHEILIRHWSTLRWWLEENRSRLRAQRQIEQAAQQWQQSGQQTDFLLRGVRLDAAEELYVKYTDELSQNVQRFIETGLTERNREQKQLKQRLRRAQAAVMLIGTLGLSAAGFGGFAYLQRQRALINEISTLNALSESQFLAHQQLESLTTSLQAGKRLQQIFWLGIDGKTQARIKLQTAATMQQAIEETQERNRLSHPQQVNSVAVSADGTQIVSGSDDETVRLWQANGMLIEQLTIAGRVTAVGFSPDGQWVAASSSDGMTLWNPTTDTKTTLRSGDWVTSLAVSSNGKFLVTANRDQTIKLWNLTNSTLLTTLTGHQGFVNAVQFSPNNRTIATAGEDGKVIIWDINQSTLIKTLNGHQGRVTNIAFSPNGETLASTGEDQTIRFWTISSGQSQVWKAHEKQINSVQFSRDGQRLISASADRTLKLWNVADGVPLATLNGHGDAILSATFTPDGQFIISGSADKTVRVWNIAARIPNRSNLVDANISAFSISPTGQIATATWDGQIRWHQQTISEPPIKIWKAHRSAITSLSFSPDGQRLLSGSDDRTLKIWDRNSQLLLTLAGHEAKVASTSFSPDAKWIASVSEDKTVRLWNASSGELIRILEGHQDGVSSVSWHPNSQILATGSYDNTIKLWKTNGTLIRTLAGHRLAIAAVAFSPDGDLLASASWDNTIKLWDTTQGTHLQTLTGHQDGVTSLSFISNSTLISGSADRTLKLWHQDGVLIKTLVGESEPISSLNLSSDGKKLFTLSNPGIHTWNLNLSDLEQQGCEQVDAYLRANSNRTTEKSLCQKE